MKLSLWRLAVAMDAGLERTLREERDRLTALAEASTDFATAGTRFREVADRVVRRVAELIGDSCLMMLVSRDGHWLKPTALFHVDPEALKAMGSIAAPRPIDVPSLAAEVVRDNQPLRITSLDMEAVRSRMWPEVQAFVERFGTHSLLFVPMRARGQVIGALGLTRESARPDYTTEDQAFLQTLADTAAAALESVRLAQEARRQLQQRRRAKELSRRIIESTPDCIQVLDFQGQLLMLNEQSQRQMGLEPAGAWFGVPWTEVWAEADREAASHALDAARRGESGRLQAVRAGADGRSLWWDVVVTPMQDDEGRPDRLLAIARDVTERKVAEEQRAALLEGERQARAAAERASLVKDEFLATVSHELRTPLNAVLGWTHLLRISPGDPAIFDRAVATIERNALIQSRLVADLIDVARVVSGQLRLDLERVEVAPLVEDALASLQPAAEAKQITRRVEIEPGSLQVRADPARVRQIAWNLLSNAIKFTPKRGEVVVALRSVGSDVVLTVADNGEGIAPEFLPHVFERFRQADASPARQQGGLGLGLALVRHLVELHGGHITAESDGTGRGARFVVRLPRADDEAPQEPALRELGPTPSLTRCRVLLVDDDPNVRETLGRALRDHGATVVTVASAGEALQAIEQSPPSVLVADIGLPDQDGYALIRRIRELPPERGGAVPALALTAHARAEDRMRALLAGYQMHVPKPSDPLEVAVAVARLLRPGGEPDPVAAC